MASGVVNEQEVKRYAQEFTDEVSAGATESGEAPQVQLLSNVKEALGDSKLLNDPQFFYWQMSISPMTIELCGYDIDEIDNRLYSPLNSDLSPTAAGDETVPNNRPSEVKGEDNA